MIAVAVFLALSQTETPFRVPAKMPDTMVPISPSQVKIEGYIGNRIKLSEQNRLRDVDLKPLLAGFHQQPGSHPWIGEHIGKWIHASTLAWANTGDPKLKTKLDAAVKELISCQQSDGYLGTYSPDKRFGLYEGADWDVWTHKYDLLGLLTYYRFTGDKASLACCEKIGDLLVNTFGTGKKSILSAGTHKGMASTSVLEPMVLLYRYSGNPKYLDFALSIVKSWEEPGGPNIIETLRAGRPIDQVANGKAYEMLSNLVGLCELARVTGHKVFLDAAEKAWDDVVKHELYLTGSASYYEHFHAGDDLPNQMSKNVGETCVTVTWMQLSQQLLRLTGRAKYADELERSAYNHLAAAQKPDGSAWCYYTSLEGTKPYTTETCCCLSSGPRGMAILPETSYMIRGPGSNPYIVVNTLETSKATFSIDGKAVSVVQKSEFPKNGKSTLTINSDKGLKVGVMIRNPKWATGMKVSGSVDLNRPSAPDASSAPGFVEDWMLIFPKTWKNGKVDIKFGIQTKSVLGKGSNSGLLAWTYGPFVMACESKSVAILAKSIRQSTVIKFNPETKTYLVPIDEYGQTAHIDMLPFADIGANGERYKVWIPATPSLKESVFSGATESRSQTGNADGSVVDDDPGTYVVTYNGKPQGEAWFAASLPISVEISRITFTQGPLFHDGGWFDTSKGKPIVQVQTTKDGPWITVGTLDSYPATTATNSSGVKDRQSFTLSLSVKQRVFAICVSGVPACGDNPKQAFTSCAELQALRS